MCGELGMAIRKIEIREFEDGNHEMTFYDKTGTFLNIVGDNDLKTLLTEALRDIKSPYKIKTGGNYE